MKKCPCFPKGRVRACRYSTAKSKARPLHFALETLLPAFDVLPDGCWIVAAGHCQPGEANARTLSPTGALIRRFAVGDAIAHLQCDAQGAIWVGYRDENRAECLNKFDSHGRELWAFAGVANASDDDESYMYDCYALNVSGEKTWTYYYTGFPVVEIDALHKVRAWHCPVAGAHALAVEGQLALIAGGYGEERNRLVLAGLDRNPIRIIEEFRLDIPEKPESGTMLFHARGNALHVVREGVWRRVMVSDVVNVRSTKLTFT